MPATMTSRQRVQTALNFEEPDRVPTALWGGPYGIVDEVYFRLLERFDLGQPVPPFRSGHTISYIDDRVLDRLGTDLRYVYPTLSPTSPSQATADPDTFLDAFGQTWKRAYPYYYTAAGLLTDITHAEQIDEHVHWPDPDDPKWFAGVRARAEHLRTTTSAYIVARMVVSHGPFQTACDLRGTEKFIFDMTDNPELAHTLIERITATFCALSTRYLEACGDNIDMIELPGDDYAGNTNLILSPRMFRQFIQPAVTRLVQTIKTCRPGIKVMLHSDGAIQKLIPDLIATGIDVLHPLEPLPANDLAAIKATYGRQVAFLGGIDISHALPGSAADVIAETRRRIAQLAPGGGYILAPANHIQADVPAENILTLYQTAQQFGVYPINLS